MKKRNLLSVVVVVMLLLVMTTVSYAADLPNVVILATGGTIAGSAASNTSYYGIQSGRYRS
jgi:L-asparaginase